jgi:hypothetical protein
MIAMSICLRGKFKVNHLTPRHFPFCDVKVPESKPNETETSFKISSRIRHHSSNEEKHFFFRRIDGLVCLQCTRCVCVKNALHWHDQHFRRVKYLVMCWLSSSFTWSVWWVKCVVVGLPMFVAVSQVVGWIMSLLVCLLFMKLVLMIKWATF